MSLMPISFLFAAFVVASGVAAQTMPQVAPKPSEPGYGISYNVGVVSDYRFRGMSQTSGGPAVQGGADFAFKNSVYLGAWASNVRWVRALMGASNSSTELDFYGGYKGELGKGVSFDAGAVAYFYPGNNSGQVGTLSYGTASNVNTKEIYGALSYGIYTAKYSHSLGDFLGFIKSAGSRYWDVSAAIDVGNGLTLTPHLGGQAIAGAGNSPYGYVDVAIALAKDMGNSLTLTGTITSTNANSGLYTELAAYGGKAISKSAVALGAKYSF